MTQALPPSPPPLPPAGRGLTRADGIGAAFCLLWGLGLWLWQGVIAPDGALPFALNLLLFLIPCGFVLLMLAGLRMLRAVRGEAAALQATVEALRMAYLAGQQAGSSPWVKPAVERRLEEIVASVRQSESLLAAFAARRPAGSVGGPGERRAALVPPPKPAALDEQPALALGTSAEDFRAPLSMGDFIKALDFPENAEDREGFRALRLALEDSSVARLIRAAQDVLTLLSQDGIYMDDLTPEAARPELWRRFAGGERGKALSALGGIRDRASLALASARMRDDPVFRDACHHFLRSFDKTFVAFVPNASDAELLAFADSRTARAFMLIGRISGAFE